jgi:excisionase family DNA binding protein
MKTDRVHSTEPSKRLLSISEAGAITLGSWFIRRLIYSGELPYLRVGKRRIAIDPDDLEAYIQRKKQKERT